MIDLKTIRAEPDRVRWAAKVKNAEVDVDRILELDQRRRDALYQGEQLKAKQNEISKQIGAEIAAAKKEGREASPEEAKARYEAVVEDLKAKIRELEAELALGGVEAELDNLLLWVPNIPEETVPIGDKEEDNVEAKRWGELPRFDFEPKGHWEVGVNLGIIDFEAAVRMSGAQFALTRGLGAAMERALINFMLDLHIRKHGYTEICPPYMTLPETVVGTAHLPKFEQDLFRLREGLYLIPTAEVPLTALHFGEIIDGERLPLHYTAYTPCFRSEAGSAGKETRGMIRLHQFHKVELMKYCRPEEEAEELQKLVVDAEAALMALGLPFRRMRLCTGEMSFAACEAFDLEVWMPGMGKYVEISSCSRYRDFQARRCNTRYRDGKGKPQFVSTMNGSALACGRTFAAILENCQQEDGTVLIPEALRPYMGGASMIYGP